MNRWRRVLRWELGAGSGLLVWFLGFESGRGWQFVVDQGRVLEVQFYLELVAALHCILGRT